MTLKGGKAPSVCKGTLAVVKLLKKKHTSTWKYQFTAHGEMAWLLMNTAVEG